MDKESNAFPRESSLRPLGLPMTESIITAGISTWEVYRRTAGFVAEPTDLPGNSALLFHALSATISVSWTLLNVRFKEQGLCLVCFRQARMPRAAPSTHPWLRQRLLLYVSMGQLPAPLWEHVGRQLPRNTQISTLEVQADAQGVSSATLYRYHGFISGDILFEGPMSPAGVDGKKSQNLSAGYSGPRKIGLVTCSCSQANGLFVIINLFAPLYPISSRLNSLSVFLSI